MKQFLLAVLFISSFNATSNAQTKTALQIKIKLKNSSLLPKRITIISYQPGDEGNGTEQITMAPRAEKTLVFREGTKLYVASTKQVDIVMSGKRIDQDKPFLIVKREDAGGSYPLP